jgi:hypothetical protein
MTISGGIGRSGRSTLPLSIINSIVADKGLCKYPRGISAVSRYCHRFLHQCFPNSQTKILKSLLKKADQTTDLDVDICSMKCLIELLYNAFPRLPQIQREWYLCSSRRDFARRLNFDRLLDDLNRLDDTIEGLNNSS